MEFNAPPEAMSALHTLARRAVAAGGRLYLVGGSVRDALRGAPVAELDAEIFGLPPERVESDVLGGFRWDAVGRAFGIFKIHGLPIDLALPRTEHKTGLGHRAVATTCDPQLDVATAARRRDFTLNAMYWDVVGGQLVDPWGGVADMEARVLRHVSDQFVEDPLRVLRAMQLAARLNCTVAPATVALCAAMTPETLSRERFLAEWEKWLLQGRCLPRGLQFLRECGWLRYYPELAATCGCPQDPAWHPEGDVWDHTLACLDAWAAQRSGEPLTDRVVGWAVLCHDLGKPLVTRRSHEGRWIAHGHEAAGVEPARSLMQRIGVPLRIIEHVLPLVGCHMRPAQLFERRSSMAAVRRLAEDAGRIDWLLQVFAADSAGRPPLPANSQPASDWLAAMANSAMLLAERPRPILLGRHLLAAGWQPGPHLGPLLRAAFQAQLDGAFATADDGVAWARNNAQQ
jgi:tRNA nucleotidyltransferase (CCA-adding enzyme)